MRLLPRVVRPLLRQVGGKRHASDDDHEEPTAKRRSSPVVRTAQTEEDVNAEPESSDSELRLPPRIKQAPIPSIPEINSPTRDGIEELKVPQRKSGRKQPDTRSVSEDTAGERPCGQREGKSRG